MMPRALLWVVAAMSLGAHAHMGPHPEAGVGFEQHIGAVVPLDSRFAQARGTPMSLREAIADKPTVLVLGYARCHELCATTVPGMAEALDQARLAAGGDYRAVFVSIDAREDSAALGEVLARVPTADRGAWHFLGGNGDGVRDIAQAVGLRYRYEPHSDAFAHPAGFVVLTPRGVVSRYFFGVRFDSADVRRAIEEAGRGATGSLAERLLLLCYHLDPLTGRHSAAILDVLRGMAVACVLVFAFLFMRARKRGTGA
jgi:protein SCO1/2